MSKFPAKPRGWDRNYPFNNSFIRREGEYILRVNEGALGWSWSVRCGARLVVHAGSVATVTEAVHKAMSAMKSDRSAHANDAPVKTEE